MTAEGTAKEMKLFLEALMDTVKKFKKKSPETRYALSFGYVVRGVKEATPSEVLEYLDRLQQGIAQHSDEQKLAVEVNIPMVNRLQDDFQHAVAKYVNDRQPKENKPLQAVPDNGTN